MRDDELTRLRNAELGELHHHWRAAYKIWFEAGQLEVASLILGIIVSVTGVGAKACQVITWTRSGPVVTLTATDGPIHKPKRSLSSTQAGAQGVNHQA